MSDVALDYLQLLRNALANDPAVRNILATNPAFAWNASLATNLALPAAVNTTVLSVTPTASGLWPCRAVLGLAGVTAGSTILVAISNSSRATPGVSMGLTLQAGTAIAVVGFVFAEAGDVIQLQANPSSAMTALGSASPANSTTLLGVN